MLWLGNIFLPGRRGAFQLKYSIQWWIRRDLLGDISWKLQFSSIWLLSPFCSCSLLSLILWEHPSSPPLCAVLPPASGGKIFPRCCTSITAYPRAAGAEQASGELRLGVQPSLREARAHFLGQAAHMASPLLAAPSPGPAGSAAPVDYIRLMSFFLTLGDVPGPSERSLTARGVLAKCGQLVEYDLLRGPGSQK